MAPHLLGLSGKFSEVKPNGSRMGAKAGQEYLCLFILEVSRRDGHHRWMYSVHMWHTSFPLQTGQNERMSWQLQNTLGAWAVVGMIHPISASGPSKSTLSLPHQEFPPIHRLDSKYLLFIHHSFINIVHLLFTH